MTTEASGTEPPAYLMGRSEAETRRLMAQHRLYGRFTRRLLEDAGIGEGMKVLDVGSGAGDVALLSAELVGPTGSVVGVDQDPEVLEDRLGPRRGVRPHQRLLPRRRPPRGRPRR